jgi:hypothetical protein
VKVLRYLFGQMPDQIPSAKAMDEMKNTIPKLPEHRLFVTEQNFAIFGESTHKGVITQNCYESIRESDIALPRWFRRTNRKYVTMGEL